MNDTPSYRLIAAAVIVVAYFIVAGILLNKALSGGTIPNWDQIIVVFNAVGALATTAAGVLLGAEVQQSNVRAAQFESRARAAEVQQMRSAIADALESLEPTAAAANAVGNPANAKSVLRRALA